MSAERGAWALVVPCLLALCAGCVTGWGPSDSAHPVEFSWKEPLELNREQLEVGFGRPEVAEQVYKASHSLHYHSVKDLAQRFAKSGIVRSYRLLTVAVGSQVGFGVQWYVRTPTEAVFMHDWHRYPERLVKEGLSSAIIVFLDKSTANDFEAKLRAAKPEQIRSAAGFSTADIYTLFDVQEGDSVWSAQVYNLVAGEDVRRWLLERGGPLERTFMEETESAAAIDRAFDWLRERLDTQSVEKPD